MVLLCSYSAKVSSPSLLPTLVEGSGIPAALYRNQHSMLQRNDKHWSLEEQLAGEPLPTQLGRMR